MRRMNGLPYYRAYPRDFIEGTIGMPFEIKCAYRVVLDLIYMQGGDLPDDARYISGLLGCSIRKWKSIREELVSAGKIQVSGEFLANKRADKELESLAKYQDNQSERVPKSRKNKDLQEPRQSQPEPEPYKDTLEPIGSNGADAPNVRLSDFLPKQEKPVDATKEAIWKRGVPYLVESGIADAPARKLVGQWLRDYGAPWLFDALAESKRAETGDPVPYVIACLEARAKAEAQPTNDDIMKGILERTANAV